VAEAVSTRTSRPAGAAKTLGLSAGLAVAVSIADAIESFDLSEVAVYGLKLFAQPFDVAVDRAVVDIYVLTIGSVHQLVTALDVPGAVRQRF
jgi:ACT domain-containing protein